MAEKTFCIYLTFSVLIEISITESKANANNASQLLTWLSFLEQLPKLCINNRKTMEQLANWLCDFRERKSQVQGAYMAIDKFPLRMNFQ